jgi:hypothetical protein
MDQTIRKLAYAALASLAFCGCKEAHQPLTEIGADQIKKAFSSKSVNYSSANVTDVAFQEKFYKNGVWTGQSHSWTYKLSTGRWFLHDNKICIEAAAGSAITIYHQGPHCRTVWQNPRNGELFMDHIYDGPKQDHVIGFQALAIIRMVEDE